VSANIKPTDPVFISYRHSDGMRITGELAWLLRAAGIPVWRDQDDLPPGDTNERLTQAIEDGLSGGVLVITPEVADSTVVRTVEAPRLIALHQAEPAFALGIANAVEKFPGRTDYAAPDRLLELPAKTLEGADQNPTTRAGLVKLVGGLLGHRVAEQREVVADADGVFVLSVQTRNTPQVYDRTGAQLDIRVRPSTHERLPDLSGLDDLAATIGLLPTSVTRAGAQRVRVTGGAHLSVAFALGAALPSSRLGAVEVIDQRDETWVSGTEGVVNDPPMLQVVASGTGLAPAGARPAVLVYADLLPTPSDAAFDRLLEEHASTFASWQKITSADAGLLQPADGGRLSGELAARIREASTLNGNAEVHLLLRVSFPIAVLTGRLMNTLRVTVYEWDDTDPPDGDDFRPRYVPVMKIRASAGTGAIAEVL
jgi:hypothetical protein